MSLGPSDFTRLYRRHAPALLVFFQRRVHDPEVATDLLADTFAIAIERAWQFRGRDDRAAGGWIWQIAQSVLRNHQARETTERRGRTRLELQRRALTDGEIERIEELAGLEQLRVALQKHLEKLPSEQEEAVRLRVVDGLTYRQIGELLGVDVQNARARVSRGLRRLSGALATEHRAWHGGEDR